MINSKLAIHHIGARGPTQAFPPNVSFDPSIINVLYEADPACIDQLKALNRERAARIIVLNECISGTGGARSFCDAHHGYGSSLLEANAELRDLYIPAHWIDYDYTVYEAISARSRRRVETRTLDQISAERNDVPFPDFLSLDTQGSELEILQGSPGALGSALCIVTEVEFLRLYENQPLFGDICRFLTDNGFVFAKLFPVLNGSMHRAPLGLRGSGLPVTADALFLRDPRSIAASGRDREEKALCLAKLGFFSICQSNLEHALWALQVAEPYAWGALDLAESWYVFLVRFFELSRQFPDLMPPTFGENEVNPTDSKLEFVRRGSPQIATLKQSVVAMLELLRAYDLDEAAETVLRMTDIDLRRLGLPSLAITTNNDR
jgi:FkbM family methyltransferase